jgi:hypothetical protein
MSIEELRQQALTLNNRDRAALAHDLLTSLDSLSPEELRLVWADEADRRLQELQNGTADEIPGPEVVRQARALVG